MKKILAIILAALLILCFVGCSKDDELIEGDDDGAKVEEGLIYENFEYGVNEEGNYEITGFVYSGADKISVNVPAEIGGRPVTGIGDEAFKAMSCINAITIPDSIKYIGEAAFFNCDYITEITLPATVTTIKVNAFNDCSALAKITMPGVTTIENYAFAYCSALTDIVLPLGKIAEEITKNVGVQ